MASSLLSEILVFLTDRFRYWPPKLCSSAGPCLPVLFYSNKRSPGFEYRKQFLTVICFNCQYITFMVEIRSFVLESSFKDHVVGDQIWGII